LPLANSASQDPTVLEKGRGEEQISRAKCYLAVGPDVRSTLPTASARPRAGVVFLARMRAGNGLFET
jgi:hypothetical protein